MKRSVLGAGALVVAALGLLPGCEPGPIRGQGYEIVFEDQFDTLDTTVWATAPYGGSLPASVTDGVMTLRTTAANGYRWGQIASTGQRRSSPEPNYPNARAWEEGSFEARIRYTSSEWTWPAFWLFSMDKAEAWPDEHCPAEGGELTSEWDIFDNGSWDGTPTGPHHFFSGLHRNTWKGKDENGNLLRYCGVDDEQRTNRQELGDEDLSDWHVWSSTWTADEVCTYLDEVELWCTPTYDTTAQPMHLTFSMQKIDTCERVLPGEVEPVPCEPAPSELTMEVDWVRVWQKP